MQESKTISIHQPNFLPWLGYFHKIMKSDVFVFLDDVEYTKNSFINRNKIKTPQGEQWITLPVNYSGNSRQKINEVELFSPMKSKKKILASLELNYKKAEFFNTYFGELSEIIITSDSKLASLNIALINWIYNKLEIDSQIFISSELNITEEDPNDRLISICKKFDGRHYISGFGGDNYLDHQKFEDAGIKLVRSQFKQSAYPQKWGEFIPNMSVIDGFLNLGTSLKDYLN